jgi:hypothetical protein
MLNTLSQEGRLAPARDALAFVQTDLGNAALTTVPGAVATAFNN